MKKIIRKIIGVFTVIGTYLAGLADKVYAIDIDTRRVQIDPAYGVKEPIKKSNILVNGFFLILLPIAAIITIIVGTRKYIKKSTASKTVKILISIIAIIVILILIRVLLLGINNLSK